MPLIILSLFSIFFGYLFSDMFVGMGSDFFGNSVFIHPNNITLVEAEYSLSLLIKLLPSILSLLGASSALILYLNWPEIILSLTETSAGKKIYTFLNSKYYFDLIYNNYVLIRLDISNFLIRIFRNLLAYGVLFIYFIV